MTENLNDTAATLDPERQQKAKEYARISRRLFVVELVFGAVYVIFWIISGLSPWLRDQVHSITTATWLAVPLFALGFGLPYAILTAPLDYYSGFVLPHKYEQSVQSLKEWLIDKFKGLLISGVLGLIVLETIYWLLGIAPETWWLWAALVMLALTVILGTLAPVLIFPLFYKYKPLDNEELVIRLTQLAENAKTRVKGVYEFDMSSKTVAANAALMGLGNTRRIVLGDTLIQNFTVDEIETVLAHELGHHVHKGLNPHWFLAGRSGDAVGYSDIWLRRPDRSGDPAATRHRVEYFWFGDHASRKYLVPFAGGQGRYLCAGNHAKTGGVYQRHDPAGQPKPGRC